MEVEVEDLGIGQRLARRKLRSVRSQSFGTKLTVEEETELERAAERQGQTASEWAREVLLREARRTQDDPVFTEIIGTRILLNHVLKHLAVGSGMTVERFAEILESVRSEKRSVAQDVMGQYTRER